MEAGKPKYFLRSDVYLCAIGCNAMLLDLETRKYLSVNCQDAPDLLQSLSAAAKSVRRTLLFDGAPGPASLEAISGLLQRGILTTSPVHASVPPPESSPPTRSLALTPPMTPERPTGLAIVRFLGAFVDVQLRLRLFGLRSLVKRFQTRHDGSKEMPSPETLRVVQCLTHAFCRIRPWIYTAHNRCLVDSLILAEFLHRYGYPARLVIAIEPMPFSAHAWVQLGECVIDDTVEAVRRFAPILVA